MPPTVIEESLARVLEGATGLLVVHRPSTLALADRVALVDGGYRLDQVTPVDQFLFAAHVEAVAVFRR